ELESRFCRLAPHHRRQVAVEHRRDRRQRGGGVADRGGVAGVGVDQDGGNVAAVDRTGEIRRQLDDEEQLALRQPALRLRFGGERADFVIAAVLQRGGQRALV